MPRWSEPATTKSSGYARQWGIVDGQAGPEYSTVSCPVFSPDSRHVAYRARQGHAWVVVVDGRPGPKCAALCAVGPTFDGDAAPGYLAGKDQWLYRTRHRPVP
jgi:hypothetical protein